MEAPHYGIPEPSFSPPFVGNFAIFVPFPSLPATNKSSPDFYFGPDRIHSNPVL